MTNISLIGCGDWGSNIAASLSKLGVLFQVADKNSDKAESISKLYQVEKTCVENIIHNDSVDAICIAVPNPYAEDLARDILNAKLPVFIEKPIATSSVGLERLLYVAEQNDQFIMTGHLLLFHQSFIALKNLIHSQTLGKIKFIHSRRESYGKFFSNTNVIWDYGPHDISMILNLVGENCSDVAVQSLSTSLGSSTDQCSAILTFPNNITARMDLSRISPNKIQSLDIYCDGGIIQFCDTIPSVEKKIRVLKYKNSCTEIESEKFLKPSYYPQFPLDSELEFFANQVKQSNYKNTNTLEIRNIIGTLEKIELAGTRHE